MEEIWKDIIGYEGIYQISNTGKVKSIGRDVNGASKSDKIRAIGIRNGYAIIPLWKNSKCTTFKVHRLVATYFIDNNENKECVNHIDGNKLNNTVSNLEWCTHAENNLHAYKTGLHKPRYFGNTHHNVQFTDNEVRELRKIINSGLFTGISIARAYGISTHTVSKLKRGHTYKYVN